MRELHDIYTAWKTWSQSDAGRKAREQGGDGWEALFPNWTELMEAAKSAMMSGCPSPTQLEVLANCWRISHEDEDLLFWAKDHIQTVFPVLIRLAGSEHRDTRWQIFDALGNSAQAENILRHALEDPDSYCRRRALLALARRKPVDAHLLAQRFAEDPDPHMRLAALEMASHVSDPQLVTSMVRQLAADAVQFVRERAGTVLVTLDSA